MSDFSEWYTSRYGKTPPTYSNLAFRVLEDAFEAGFSHGVCKYCEGNCQTCEKIDCKIRIS
jgi:hypothetical protein